MIKLRIKGRLGNQLFIYAFARKIVEKYNQDVLLYDRCGEKDPMWYSHLGNYRLNKRIHLTDNKKQVMKMKMSSKCIFLYDRIMSNLLSKNKYSAFQSKNQNLYIKNSLFLKLDGYEELPEKMNSDCFCDGYFQSAKYFDDIRAEVIQELMPIHNYTEYEKKLLYDIENTNSVCVTIRLGDFVNNPLHQVCNKEFYYKAIDVIKEKVENPHFFIFSDDMNGVKEMFDFGENATYDSGKMKDYVSLYIMSQCKHFIISNSTFSWWAQYMGDFKDKIVVSPCKWYADDIPCDLMSDSWIKIDTRI